jgi:hypothetical protein
MIRISTPFKFITIIFVSAFFFIVQQALSYDTGPPTGMTGAPGESDCTSCHSGTAISNSSAISVYSNMTNGQYIPDSTYHIIVRARKSSCVKFGFETTMLNSNSSPSKMGTLAIPTSATDIQLSSGTRDYIYHTFAGTTAIYNDSTEWTFNWQAPSTLSGAGKLYVAMNATNNDGTNSGDEINLNSFTFPQTTNVPVATITTNVNSICQNDSILFQGSGTNGTSSYQWTFPGGTPSSATAQNLYVKFAGSGSKVCSLRVTNSIMNSVIVTKSITVNALPSATISYNSGQVLCQGDSIALTATFNALYSYQWQKDGSIINGATANMYYANANGNYRVSVTNNSGGCSITTTPIALSFNTKPLAILLAPAGTTTCQGDSIRLEANSGANFSYAWYKDNVLQSTTADSNFYAKQSGVYNVKVTNPTCNTFSNTISISFFVKPSASITASIDSVCQGDSILLTSITADTIANYQWKKDGTNISGANGQNYYALSGGSYSVDLTTNRGCKASAGPKTIKVNALPAPNFIDSIKVVCTYLLKIRNTGSFNFQWQRNGVTFNISDTIVTASQSGTYTLKITNSSGCSITTNSIFLNINNAPNANITPVLNAVMCSDSSGVTYQVPSASATTYQWYKNGTLITGATQNSLNIVDSGNYYVMVDNGICAVQSSTRNVRINAIPTAIISTVDSTFCTGDSSVLNAIVVAGATYQWNKNNVALTNANSNTYIAKSTGSYNVFVTLNTCSKISNAVNVTEKLLPAVPVITRNVNVLTSTSATSYQWFKNGLAISGATQQNYTVTSSATYTVEVTGTNGCKNISAGLFVIPTGINVSAITNIVSAYPNPVHRNLNLNFGDYNMHEIIVYDASGRVLKSLHETDSKAVIDFSDVDAGIYFVKVSSMVSTQIIRVVKK